MNVQIPTGNTVFPPFEMHLRSHVHLKNRMRLTNGWHYGRMATLTIHRAFDLIKCSRDGLLRACCTSGFVPNALNMFSPSLPTQNKTLLSRVFSNTCF